MPPRHDYRWAVVLLANLVLVWLVGLANHYLASFGLPFTDHATLYLYPGGLLVAYAALQLDARNGFIAVAATALAVDALTPVPFGTSLFLYGFAFAVLIFARQRFPRDEPVFGTVVTLIANLFLFLGLSSFLVGVNPRPAEAWGRLFFDLVASQLLLLLITPWFLALQVQAFAFLRIHPTPGRRIANYD